MINRRLSLRSQLCAAITLLTRASAERALNRASPLDREHKRLDEPKLDTALFFVDPDCATNCARAETDTGHGANDTGWFSESINK